MTDKLSLARSGDGWAGKTNGELLELAAGSFDAFLTVDRGIQYLQNLSGIGLGMIAMQAASNDIDDLRPVMPAVLGPWKGSSSESSGVSP